MREGEAVVPSAILMCIGASTPIVTSDTEFVWFLDKEVIKYSNSAELERVIAGILTGEMDIGNTLKAAKEYAIGHSPKIIANDFIELFTR